MDAFSFDLLTWLISDAEGKMEEPVLIGGGDICPPPVGKGLTDLPNIGVPPLPASLGLFSK